MPTYVYECPECKKQTEVMHSFKETPALQCDDCKVALKKKFVPNSAFIIGNSFREGRERQPSWVGQKLEEFKEHPERDPYRAQRESK